MVVSHSSLTVSFFTFQIKYLASCSFYLPGLHKFCQCQPSIVWKWRVPFSLVLFQTGHQTLSSILINRLSFSSLTFTLLFHHFLISHITFTLICQLSQISHPVTSDEGSVCVCVWFMATSEPDLLSEYLAQAHNSKTQLLKEELLDDGVSAVLEIPQTFPVVLWRHRPTYQLVVKRHCSRDDNGDQLLSLYPVALTSFTLSVEEFLSFWGGSREKYEGPSLKAFELRQYSRPSERSPLLSLSQLFQRNWPYQLQWLPAPWGDASATLLCILSF